MKYLLALAALSCGAAWAAEDTGERWFQVEVLAFAHRNPQTLNSEQWPLDPGFPALDQIVELTPPDLESKGLLPGAPYRLLGSGDWQLVDAARRLERSNNYETLLHVAWRQPTVDPHDARPVYLDDNVGKFPAAATGDGATPAPDAVAAPRPEPRLAGTLKLGVSRYLHLEADLVYKMLVDEALLAPPLAAGVSPTPAAAEHQKVLRSFRLTEARRMRSKELHYFDHPLFGMVVLVTPVDLNPPPPPPKPAVAAPVKPVVVPAKPAPVTR